MHLKNPIEIKKLKSYQDELFLKNEIFNQLKDDIGKDDFFEFEQGYLSSLVTMAGLAIKEIGFCEEDLEKIKKNIRIYLLFCIKLAYKIRNLGQMRLLKNIKKGKFLLKSTNLTNPH